VAIKFTVDHDHTYEGDEGEEQLVGWIHFEVTTKAGDLRAGVSGGNPKTVKLPRRSAWLAADGHLYKDATSGLPFRLVANDPEFNLDHLTYKATFELTTLLGVPVDVPHTYFPAPSTDTTAYITRFLRDPDQTVMEVRAKLYAEDIIDLSDYGRAVLTGSGPVAYGSIVAVDSATNAEAGEMVDADATNGGFTITLPEEPPDLTVVSARKKDTTANPVLVQRSGSDVFTGGVSLVQLLLPGESGAWQYDSGVWRPVTHSQTVVGLDQRYHLKKAVPGSAADIRVLDANGAAAIEINSTTNAINYLRVANGAAGGRVNLRVGGRDSQIHLGLRPKGSSSAVQIMDSNGVLVAHFITGSGTPVNYFMFQSSATAEAVPISAIGSDSVISINVVPKGTTGTLQVNGNAIANRSGELITSQINDTNGNGAIFITATASAVNYAQITNAAAGGTVHFRVTGASSNIPLALRAKGTSAVQILDPSLNLIASFLPGTTPVNSWLFYSAGSGTAVEAQAIGSDTDVSISLKPKGVGTVNVTTGITVSGTSAVWKSGSGSPEGVVTAPVGSLWTRTNGGASTTLYVKESGSGNTGWKAVQTA